MISLKSHRRSFAERKGRARRSARATRPRGQAGFTLVEMLVVITIIGLIMGLIGPRVLNYLSESKVKAAQDPAAELRQRARPVLSRCRPVSLDGGRPGGAGAADAGRRRLERTVSQGRQRSRRSLEPRLCLSLAGRTRPLRHHLLRIRRPGRRQRHRRGYFARKDVRKK